MNATQADIYTDFHGLAQLKAQAGRDQSAALEQTARQFEAIFLKMMIKSMRDAVPESGLLNEDSSRFYRTMYDDQLSLSLSQNPGIGLADLIVQQLGGAEANSNAKTDPGMTLNDYRAAAWPARPQAMPTTTDASAPVQSIESNAPVKIESPQDFVEQLWPHAEAAAKSLGVAPEVLLAQSALETGWGQHIIRDAKGQVSFNLFGIKAHRDWEGDFVTVSTLEYEDHVAVRKQEPFRAYSGFEESFQDYVAFLRSNPRYEPVLNESETADDYIQGLQSAGYATDPKYADKIRSILNRTDFTEWVDALKAEQPLPTTA